MLAAAVLSPAARAEPATSLGQAAAQHA
jgi:hypothetical protein